jgi:hypothetical protein
MPYSLVECYQSSGGASYLHLPSAIETAGLSKTFKTTYHTAVFYPTRQKPSLACYTQDTYQPHTGFHVMNLLLLPGFNKN